ncbi:MAG: Na+/H+ antiporter subunit E [Phascolarctobacterium faecium]
MDLLSAAAFAQCRRHQKYFALGVSPIAFLCYSMWLLKELVLANIDVVKATVRPELRIDPKVIRFVFRSDNPMAKVLLANSITLTPGTVTMNVTSEGIYEVHALTEGWRKDCWPELCRGK